MRAAPIHPLILAVGILHRQDPALPASRDSQEGLPLSMKPPIPKASPGWSPSAAYREGGECTAGYDPGRSPADARPEPDGRR